MKDIPRVEFVRAHLDDNDVCTNPFDQFSRWWHDAITAKVATPDAVHLATVDQHHHPDVRVVYVKDFDQRGFVFFTNYGSTKADQLDTMPYAAMNFFWHELERQIRIRGAVEKTSRAESETYFKTRPRGSQIGAWASPQSTVLVDRTALLQRYAEKERAFGEQDIPCPPYWGGFRLIPETIEFWQGRINRLHDRIRFLRVGDGQWRKLRLAP